MKRRWNAKLALLLAGSLLVGTAANVGAEEVSIAEDVTVDTEDQADAEKLETVVELETEDAADTEIDLEESPGLTESEEDGEELLGASEAVMYRMYNPNSGEHFYTANKGEAKSLVTFGWNYEGVGWVAPTTSKTPVYRLYNENAGDHHYTTDKGERDFLIRVGWNAEGTGWYSDDAKTVALYRQYNPNAVTGTHNYTTNKSENDYLVKLGWQAEGIGWYALKKGYEDDSLLNDTGSDKMEIPMSKDLNLKNYENLKDEDKYPQIAGDINLIAKKWTDKDGYLVEASETVLTNSSKEILEWLQKLQEAGIIEECYMHDQSKAISVYWGENESCVYLPKIKGSMGDPALPLQTYGFSLDTDFNLAASAGEDAAYVANKIDKYSGYQNIVTKLNDEQHQLTKIADLLTNYNKNNCNVIFWQGHGNVVVNKQLPGSKLLYSGIILMTGEQLTDTKKIWYAEMLDNGLITRDTKGFITLTQKFFEYYLPKKVNGGLFYCVACNSYADGGRFADMLIKRGFNAYCGADDYIQQGYALSVMEDVAKILATKDKTDRYHSIAYALDKARASHFYKLTVEDWKLRFGDMKLLEDADRIDFRAYDELEQALKAYNTYLSKNFSSDYKFALANVDSDYIPELVVTYKTAVHVSVPQVFTFKDKKVTELEAVGSDFSGFFYSPYTGVIDQNAFANGRGESNIFKKYDPKSGSITTLIKFFDGTSGYQVNGSSVSKATYDSKYGEYTKKYPLTIVDPDSPAMHTNDLSGRKLLTTTIEVTSQSSAYKALMANPEKEEE